MFAPRRLRRFWITQSGVDPFTVEVTFSSPGWDQFASFLGGRSYCWQGYGFTYSNKGAEFPMSYASSFLGLRRTDLADQGVILYIYIFLLPGSVLIFPFLRIWMCQ